MNVLKCWDNRLLRHDRCRIAKYQGRHPQKVSRQVIVKPDGTRQFWKLHGVIKECIRSSGDQSQSLLTREAWCQQGGYTVNQSIAALREFVEEITGHEDETGLLIRRSSATTIMLMTNQAQSMDTSV